MFSILLSSSFDMSRKHNKQIHEYIKSKVNTFIQPLVFDICSHRPSDPLAFAITWLTNHQEKLRLTSSSHDDSDEQEQQLDQVKQLQTKIALRKTGHKHHISRLGISQQVFGVFNNREQLKLRQQQLTLDQEVLVKSLIRNSIFFQNIDSRDEQVILQAIEFKKAQQYELIIKEGQAGDVLYLVESGQYDCYKLVGQENVFIKTYVSGEAFGELALMYNAPRAASIVTRKPGKLLSLDRATFSQVLKVAASRKQTIIKNAISKLEILKAIPLQQRFQLINILKQEKYHQGDYIFRQGEEGNKFYIVLDGTLVAEKLQGNQLPKIVYKYMEGDYFGQLALLNHQPRQASIKAVTSCKLAAVTSLGFQRVFGTVANTLKQQANKYHD